MTGSGNARIKPSVRMPAARRWLVYGVGGGVWITGLGWLAAHYLLRRQGDFGPESSPLEPWQLRIHGLFAFAFLWLFGMLWAAHVIYGWKSAQRRWSGALLFGVALFLILTGYLLYYLGDERIRPPTSLAHWLVGLAAAVIFFWHRFSASKPRPK